MKNLQPVKVWAYFEEILAIPRISKHEENIIAYLIDFAKTYHLDYKKDAVGNVLISKAACNGYEQKETIILQSHLDMVGEKLMEVEHDFLRDPIIAFEKDGWITAKGTTLGADDGIGIAASMAVLASDDIKHGAIECLFTADEETGMTGAFGIEEGFMTGKILLNLDSEDEGEIFIGCAGGIDTVGRFKKDLIQPGDGKKAFKLTIQGLQGGHSGDEIHKGFGNAIKLLNRFMWNADQKFDFHIAAFEGGKLRNAIPREAEASILVSEKDISALKSFFDEYIATVKNEIHIVEPDFQMSMEELSLPEFCFTKEFQQTLMNMLYACPHGEISWSQSIPGLVETSTNMAVLRDTDVYMGLVTSQRSSVESAKYDISDRIASLFTLAGGEVIHSDGYPGWEPDTNSEILKISEQAYKDLFKTDPEVKAIHAGLECGLFLEKYPDLDMVSFGPTIKGAHTPEERIEIHTVQKFWDLLLLVLERAPEQS